MNQLNQIGENKKTSINANLSVFSGHWKPLSKIVPGGLAPKQIKSEIKYAREIQKNRASLAHAPNAMYVRMQLK